ncbi:Ribonuclease P [Syntrophomonas zehnderi OL-4]|uniref:Ribonuclease P protein component n=1 Tax=Syntrophomonas zehnderi OL-4 TaxID=690567 RepID=A0A0E4C852_9FIRM|nr:ribonuclease P protein component [Syntrophomonas zehnderi]CFX25171.1 Ribonuclease P [Syntrophomonas zehnderi OL-4]
MLDKKHRINKKAEYNYIYKNGKKIQGRYIIVFIASNTLEYSRFGIVSSKKTGNAVVRNRAKRQLRAIIHNNLNKINGGYDTVIITRYNITQADFKLMEKDLLSIFKKARLI